MLPAWHQRSVVRRCSWVLLMSRINLSICERDHNALRLLSLYKNKKIILLIQEAIQQYLHNESAYNLEIRSNAADLGSSGRVEEGND